VSGGSGLYVEMYILQGGFESPAYTGVVPLQTTNLLTTTPSSPSHELSPYFELYAAGDTGATASNAYLWISFLGSEFVQV
jgi:hypothetical protein